MIIMVYLSVANTSAVCFIDVCTTFGVIVSHNQWSDEKKNAIDNFNGHSEMNEWFSECKCVNFASPVVRQWNRKKKMAFVTHFHLGKIQSVCDGHWTRDFIDRMSSAANVGHYLYLFIANAGCHNRVGAFDNQPNVIYILLYTFLCKKRVCEWSSIINSNEILNQRKPNANKNAHLWEAERKWQKCNVHLCTCEFIVRTRSPPHRYGVDSVSCACVRESLRASLYLCVRLKWE